MCPAVEVVKGREHITLQTKGELIATYLPHQPHLLILLADIATSDQELAFFKLDVKDLRNRTGGAVVVKLSSDEFGKVILDSFESKNEALNIREDAYIGINKLDRE